MEFGFTLKGRRRVASRERMIEALRGQEPERLTLYTVEIEGVVYPVKQAFCEAFGIGRHDASTTDARRVLERLGFEVVRDRAIREEPVARREPGPLEPRYTRGHTKQDLLEPQWLEIPPIRLQWSYYERWDDLAGTGEYSDVIDLPPAAPGVYEVVGGGGGLGVLYIGATGNLMRRVVDGLVRGAMLHIAGQKIRENEDLATVRVRWAHTDRPAAAEEELQRQHLEYWGCRPRYAAHGGDG